FRLLLFLHEISLDREKKERIRFDVNGIGRVRKSRGVVRLERLWINFHVVSHIVIKQWERLYHFHLSFQYFLLLLRPSLSNSFLPLSSSRIQSSFLLIVDFLPFHDLLSEFSSYYILLLPHCSSCIPQLRCENSIPQFIKSLLSNFLDLLERIDETLVSNGSSCITSDRRSSGGGFIDYNLHDTSRFDRTVEIRFPQFGRSFHSESDLLVLEKTSRMTKFEVLELIPVNQLLLLDCQLLILNYGNSTRFTLYREKNRFLFVVR
ncbi:hypothetical protein PFISCL1PPCAC_27126, partial [Pristionchus fissidentatus]